MCENISVFKKIPFVSYLGHFIFQDCICPMWWSHSRRLLPAHQDPPNNLQGHHRGVESEGMAIFLNGCSGIKKSNFSFSLSFLKVNC